MIIGLAGYAGSGKDTVGKILVEEHGFIRLAFADRVKELALKIDPEVSGEYFSLSEYLEDVNGWERAKKNASVRLLLQNIGQGVREVCGDHTWVNPVLRDIRGDRSKDYVITDVRYENEIEAITNLGGVVLWIERPGVGPVNEHASENSISWKDADFNMLNDSDIFSLSDKLRGFVNRRSLEESK